MELDRELIDITGYLGALRFVLLQLAAKFLRISVRVRIGFLRLGDQRLLTALLAGQIHSSCRAIRDQRRFAVLAVKENVRIGFDFSRRIFRGFHPTRTSRACAQVDRKCQCGSHLRARLDNVLGEAVPPNSRDAVAL